MSPSIIAVGGQKGGTSKTTIALHLAVRLAHAGRSVMLCNTDHQATAVHWTHLRRQEHPNAPDYSITTLRGKIAPEVRNFAQLYDHVIIDAGGYDSPELRYALGLANVAVIPTRASQFDAWTLPAVNDILEGIDAINPDIVPIVVTSFVDAAAREETRQEMREMLADYPRMRLSKAFIGNRRAFNRSAREGLAVFELRRRDPKAVTEMSYLYEEVMNATTTQAVNSPA